MKSNLSVTAGRRGEGELHFNCIVTAEEILSLSQTVTSLGRLKFSKRVHAFTVKRSEQSFFTC